MKTKSIPVYFRRKLIGHIWKGNGYWEAEHLLTGMSWDLIRTKKDARRILIDF